MLTWVTQEQMNRKLGSQMEMERETGIEPATFSLGS